MKTYKLINLLKDILLALTLFLFIKSQSFFISISKNNPNMYIYILTTVLLLIALAIDVYFALKTHIIDIDNITISVTDLKNLGYWILILFAIKLIGGFFLSLSNATNTANQAGLEQYLKNVPILIIFIFTVISGPVMEEILFRGFFMNVIFKNNVLFGVIISGLLFGVVHRPTNFGSFFTYVGMGIVLSLYYKRYKRIELNILLHSLNNFIGFLPYIYLLLTHHNS